MMNIYAVSNKFDKELAGNFDKAEVALEQFSQEIAILMRMEKKMIADLAKAKADAFWKNELDLTFRPDLVNNLGEAIEGGCDGKVTWKIVKRKNALTGSDYFTCEEHSKEIGWVTMAVTHTKAEAEYWAERFHRGEK